MTRRSVTCILSAVLLSTLLLALNANLLRSQPSQQHRLRGSIALPCSTARVLIWTSGTPNICPLVTIDIKNNGTCAIEVLYRCAGIDMARFGPQPGQRVIQGGFQADSIFITCQEIPNSTRCRGNYLITW